MRVNLACSRPAAPPMHCMVYDAAPTTSVGCHRRHRQWSHLPCRCHHHHCCPRRPRLRLSCPCARLAPVACRSCVNGAETRPSACAPIPPSAWAVACGPPPGPRRQLAVRSTACGSAHCPSFASRVGRAAGWTRHLCGRGSHVALAMAQADGQVNMAWSRPAAPREHCMVCDAAPTTSVGSHRRPRQCFRRPRPCVRPRRCLHRLRLRLSRPCDQ